MLWTRDGEDLGTHGRLHCDDQVQLVLLLIVVDLQHDDLAIVQFLGSYLICFQDIASFCRNLKHIFSYTIREKLSETLQLMN